jgi:hypothetical protein
LRNTGHASRYLNQNKPFDLATCPVCALTGVGKIDDAWSSSSFGLVLFEPNQSVVCWLVRLFVESTQTQRVFVVSPHSSSRIQVRDVNQVQLNLISEMLPYRSIVPEWSTSGLSVSRWRTSGGSFKNFETLRQKNVHIAQHTCGLMELYHRRTGLPGLFFGNAMERYGSPMVR